MNRRPADYERAGDGGGDCAGPPSPDDEGRVAELVQDLDEANKTKAFLAHNGANRISALERELEELREKHAVQADNIRTYQADLAQAKDAIAELRTKLSERVSDVAAAAIGSALARKGRDLASGYAACVAVTHDTWHRGRDGDGYVEGQPAGGWERCERELCKRAQRDLLTAQQQGGGK